MGATFSTYCKRCGVAAPEMGDFGFVGAPSLGPSRKKGGLTPFGVLFDGFAALRMVTTELAAFKAFLDVHRGHRLVQASDFGEEDFDGDAEDESEGRTRSPRRKAFRFRTRSVEGFYEMACTKCEETFRASTSEPLLPFEEFSPTPQEIGRFRANVIGKSEDDFYKVGGFPYDDLDTLKRFLKAHEKHSLRARIDRPRPAAAAALPPTRREPVEPWVAPTWSLEEHETYLGRVRPQTLLLLAALHHRDPIRRASACAEVAATGERGALGYLVARLDDAEEAVRQAATRAIGVLADPRGVRALGRALLDEAEEVRRAALEALTSSGRLEEEALRQARSLRGPYARAGLPKGRPTFTPATFDTALRDPHSPHYGEAREALFKKRREPWALELILTAAVEPSWSTRGDAAEALAGIKDPRAEAMLLALLLDFHWHPARQAAKALAPRRLPEALEGLTQLLTRETAGSSEASDALIRLRDPRTFAPAVAALRHASPDVRSAAARVLAALHDPRAVAPIAGLLGDPMQSVRAAAARALGALGGREAVESLAGLLLRKDDDDRRLAVEGLTALVAEEAAVSALVRALRDRVDDVRALAAHGLAPLGHREADAALLVAARRGDSAVARWAWKMLIAAGDPKTETALVRAVDYDSLDEMVRAYLYCGNPRLSKAARAARGGSRVPPRPVAGPDVRWGKRRTPS